MRCGILASWALVYLGTTMLLFKSSFHLLSVGCTPRTFSVWPNFCIQKSPRTSAACLGQASRMTTLNISGPSLTIVQVGYFKSVRRTHYLLLHLVDGYAASMRFVNDPPSH